MKQIAYILSTFPSPSETFAAREIEQLQNMGFAITVFAAGSKVIDYADAKVVPVLYRPNITSFRSFLSVFDVIIRHPFNIFRLIVLFLQLIIQSPAEALTLLGNIHTVCYFCKAVKELGILHIHAYFLSWPACIGMAVAKITGRSFSIAAHARDIFVEHGAWQEKISHADFVVCCCRQGIEHLKRHISSRYHNKLHLNHHGIRFDGGYFNDKTGAKQNSVIVAAGRFVRKKGFDYLLKAFAQVKQSHPDAQLVIAGAGPEEKRLRELIEELHLEHSVHLPGWLNKADMLMLLKEAAVLVVPSVIDDSGDRDGIPNILLEAFSAGTPVVASALEGIKEIVKHKQTGLLAKPADTGQLAFCIERVLCDKGLAVRLSSNAYELVKKDFDINVNCANLASLFEDAIYKKQKIRIVHIVEGFVGGLATYMCNVLGGLKKNGFDVALICSLKRSSADAADRISELRKAGIAVHIVPMCRNINSLWDIYCFFSLYKYLLRNRFDIVHTHCSKAGTIGRLAAFCAGIRTRFHSSHCFAFIRSESALARKFYRWIEKILAGITTRYIAVSKSDAETAEKAGIFPSDKYLIVNNGLCSLEEKSVGWEHCRNSIDRQTLKIAPDSFVVTTACRLEPYKGIFTFLQAAKFSNGRCVFLIAGDGKLKPQLQNYIVRNNLKEKVRFLGHIADIEALYSITDIVVSCSESEAQPYFLLEAMRHKLPIIGTDICGHRELLKNGRGILVEPAGEKIANAIKKLEADKKRREELAKTAYEYFKEHHRLEDQITRLTEIYKNALSEGKGQAGLELCLNQR